MSEIHCEVLARHARRMHATRGRGVALLDRLDSVSGNQPPAPGSWSPLQAIEHLNLTAELYVPKLHDGLRNATKGTAPYGRATLVGRMLLGALDPAKPRKTSTIKIFRPRRTALDVHAVRARFVDHHDEWQRILAAADGYDCGRARVATPLSPLLRMSLAQAFQLHDWHEERHVEQAERAARAIAEESS